MIIKLYYSDGSTVELVNITVYEDVGRDIKFVYDCGAIRYLSKFITIFGAVEAPRLVTFDVWDSPNSKIRTEVVEYDD